MIINLIDSIKMNKYFNVFIDIKFNQF
jgi:hypothetical protein